MDCDPNKQAPPASECSDMNKVRMKRGGRALLILYSAGVILFLVGWFLSAEAVRALWLILSGWTVIIGSIGLVMVFLILKNSS